MKNQTEFGTTFDDHIKVAHETARLLEAPFEALLSACVECIRNDGKLLFFGNGGSAADSQHIAAELSVRYVTDRKPIAAIALTTDTSVLTAAANDMGYEQVFARQVEALGRKGDIAIGITTSGKSPNVVAALAAARKAGLVTAALTGSVTQGHNDMPILSVTDHLLAVPSSVTARIQEMHITLGHLLCSGLEKRLHLV